MSKETVDNFFSGKGRTTIRAGEVSSDEEQDTDTALANEFRGLYKSRLKEMQSVEEQREETHRVSDLFSFAFASVKGQPRLS